MNFNVRGYKIVDEDWFHCSINTFQLIQRV